MLTKTETELLRVFREYLVRPGEMLCFQGPLFVKHRSALKQLTQRKLITKERFDGGYSLTSEGFAAMKTAVT